MAIFVLGASSIREVDDLMWLRCRREKILQKGDEIFLVETQSWYHDEGPQRYSVMT